MLHLAPTTPIHWHACGRLFARMTARRKITIENCHALRSYAMMNMPEAAAELIAGAAEAIESAWGFESENTCLRSVAASCSCSLRKPFPALLQQSYHPFLISCSGIPHLDRCLPHVQKQWLLAGGCDGGGNAKARPHRRCSVFGIIFDAGDGAQMRQSSGGSAWYSAATSNG